MNEWVGGLGLIWCLLVIPMLPGHGLRVICGPREVRGLLMTVCGRRGDSLLLPVRGFSNRLRNKREYMSLLLLPGLREYMPLLVPGPREVRGLLMPVCGGLGDSLLLPF